MHGLPLHRAPLHRPSRPAAACPTVFGLAAVLVLLAGSASAAPPYLKFVQGLRDRGYEDMALYELDRLAADPAVPADVKDVLDYERALTMLRMAKSQADPEGRAARLDEAAAVLERFVAAHPKHPLVPQAGSERGRILLGRAETGVLRARAADDKAAADGFRQQARQDVAKARGIFESARGKYEEQVKAFGAFVDKGDEEKRAARDAAETRFDPGPASTSPKRPTARPRRTRRTIRSGSSRSPTPPGCTRKSTATTAT